MSIARFGRVMRTSSGAGSAAVGVASPFTTTTGDAGCACVTPVVAWAEVLEADATGADVAAVDEDAAG
jgi:hypothetical protein